jgi:Ca2+-binding RTX toxin-like protein
VFAGLALGTLAPNAFASGNFSTAQDADDRIIYDSFTGDLYFDADGTGGASDAIKFATLSPGLPLTANEFTVI